MSRVPKIPQKHRNNITANTKYLNNIPWLTANCSAPKAEHFILLRAGTRFSWLGKPIVLVAESGVLRSPPPKNSLNRKTTYLKDLIINRLTISSAVVAFELGEVGLFETLMVTKQSPHHSWPWLLEHQVTLAHSFDLLSFLV